MRYVYAGPAVTIPVSAPGLRSRRRFQEDDSEIPSARRIFWRARLWPSRAFPGSMTNLAGSRSKWTRPLGFVTSPRVTGPRAWAPRGGAAPLGLLPPGGVAVPGGGAPGGLRPHDDGLLRTPGGLDPDPPFFVRTTT